jgi:hypothetical protein
MAASSASIANGDSRGRRAQKTIQLLPSNARMMTRAKWRAASSGKPKSGSSMKMAWAPVAKAAAIETALRV